MSAQPHRPLLGYAEAAEYTNLPLHTFQRLTHDGEIPALRINRKVVRFSPDDLDAWLSTQHAPAVARSIVARSRAEQGLPPTVVDEATLNKVAAILRESDSAA